MLAGLAAAGSLLATLALTVPRMLDPGTKYGVLLAALAPFGTVTALVALTIAVPPALSRGRLAAASRTVAASAAALLALHLIWIAPLFLGPHARAEGTARLTVMTQNFETGDPPTFERVLQKARVDVLVVCDAGPAQFEAAVSSANRVGLHHQIVDGGTAVFSRYPVESTRITDGGSSRTVRVSGTPIGNLTLYTLHPAPAYDTQKWASDFRKIQATISDAPARASIVVGDLNATLDNTPLRRITSIGYRDAVTQVRAGWRATWPINGSRRLLGVPVPAVLPIDHVMTSHDLSVTQLRFIELPGADHSGIVTEIGRGVG